MDYKITISKIENGYILEKPAQDFDETMSTETIVIEEGEVPNALETYGIDDSDKVAVARMLEEVANYFGFSYQKFNKDNLNIRFDKPGHKVEN